jgi:thiol-disulfide isomerase/thioredoxin
MRFPLLSLAALAACAQETAPEAPTPRVVGLDAVEARLEAGRGRPLLLNFWATWCGPCIAELPELVAVAEEFRDDDLQLVTISYDFMVPGVADAEAALDLVNAHLAKSGLEMEVLVYDEDDYNGINTLLELPGPIPVTIAFDAQGNEVARVEDQADAEGFRTLVRAALRKP